MEGSDKKSKFFTPYFAYTLFHIFPVLMVQKKLWREEKKYNEKNRKIKCGQK